jgi:hypothetical protein
MLYIDLSPRSCILSVIDTVLFRPQVRGGSHATSGSHATLVRRRRRPVTFGSRLGDMRFVRGGSIAARGAHARAREEERVAERVTPRVRCQRGGASRGAPGARQRQRAQGARGRARLASRTAGAGAGSSAHGAAGWLHVHAGLCTGSA